MADGDTGDEGESEEERLTRNLNELLQELRVTQTGVQILTGFLLTLPFTNRFPDLDALQRNVYLAILSGSVVATGLIIGPVAFHRVLFRQGERHWIVTAADRSARAGLVALAATTSGVVWLVFDLVTNRTLDHSPARCPCCSSPSCGPWSRWWRAAEGPELWLSRALGSGELGAKVREDPGQQPGDLHLGHADVSGDLLLRPPVEEPQLEDAAVTWGEAANGGRQQDAGLGPMQVGVVTPQEVPERGGAVLPRPGRRATPA
jgi:hypothetical protein